MDMKKRKNIIILSIVIILIIGIAILILSFVKSKETSRNNTNIYNSSDTFYSKIYLETNGSSSVYYECILYYYGGDMYLSNYIFNSGKIKYIVNKLDSEKKKLIEDALSSVEEINMDYKSNVTEGSNNFKGTYYKGDKSIYIEPINLVEMGIISDVYDYKITDDKEFHESLESIYDKMQFYDFFWKDNKRQKGILSNNVGAISSGAYMKCLDEQIKKQVSENLEKVIIKEDQESDLTYIIEITTSSGKIYSARVTYLGYLLKIGSN